MIPPAFYPSGPLTMGDKVDDKYREFNFDLCRAINLTSLGAALDKMIADGWIDKKLAYIYFQQAQTLLAGLRSENGRSHGKMKNESTG